LLLYNVSVKQSKS